VDDADVAVDGLGRVEKDGRVPIEVMVAAILRPTSPDLPMPVTTTWPRHWYRMSTALANWWLMRPRAFVMARASVRRTFFPVSMLPSSYIIQFLQAD